MENTGKIYRRRITDSALKLKLEAFGATLKTAGLQIWNPAFIWILFLLYLI